MSVFREMFRQHRPCGFSGHGDKYLAEVAQELRRVLSKTQRNFAHPTCRLPDDQLSELALLLIEFAEDIHNEIGLWRALERFNHDCFHDPLPLTARAAVPEGLSGFDSRRIQHLLSGLWANWSPDILLSPTHTDLRRMAESVSQFLAGRLAQLPQDSGVKNFLDGSNRYGWEVKRKLIWLGTSSYLFRPQFLAYVERHGGRPDVATTDDFVCQECTLWSGMGAIDVLAGVLDIPEIDQDTLRSWSERHAAPYRVLSRRDTQSEAETIEVRNLVNGQPYTIRMNIPIPDCPFKPGLIVFGSLTPWRGEWYWSGEQRVWDDWAPDVEADLRKNMLERNSALAYRYCPKREERARERVAIHYSEFVEYYGNDLVMFPDGLSAAAAEQKRMEAQWQAASREEVARLMKAHGLTQPGPRMELPSEFLECDRGIGAFFNPAEGQEFMREFNPVLAGFKKRGVGLTEDEVAGIRHFIESKAISPAFVLRMVREHGAESIQATYLIQDFQEETDLPYLLRRHKGHFYRKRYPSLSLIGEIPE